VGNHSNTVLSPQWGLLIGDTTGDGTVNAGDIGQTKSQSGQPVTASNFREDVTVDGSINAGDIGLVKSKSGTGLP
ncbi:MAG TPA: dockerin type I domain-containing protein, partial [Chthoniobacterales bacterium]|nr:dockerin type I domain-containing protein [Chthoniobacterales bacterium]